MWRCNETYFLYLASFLVYGRYPIHTCVSLVLSPSLSNLHSFLILLLEGRGLKTIILCLDRSSVTHGKDFPLILPLYTFFAPLCSQPWLSLLAWGCTLPFAYFSQNLLSLASPVSLLFAAGSGIATCKRGNIIYKDHSKGGVKLPSKPSAAILCVPRNWEVHKCITQSLLGEVAP